MSSKQFYPFKDFQSDQIQRSSRKIFTAHYACKNANLNLTPVTGTNLWHPRGGSRIFFTRGCTRLLLYFNTNKPHSFLFFLQNTSCIRKPQVISGGDAHPLHPPPRSAPAPIVLCDCFSNLRLCFESSTKYQPKHRQDCDHDSRY